MATASDVGDFCVVCGKETTKICSKCKARPYCGKKCQRNDWESHGPSCKLAFDNVAWCDVCSMSQNLRAVCFQCGHVFCMPCCQETERKDGLCPGCSRPLTKSTVAAEENVQAVKTLIGQEINCLNDRRSFWCLMLGQIFERCEPKNIPLAKHYLNLAGNLGHRDGYVRLGDIHMKEGDWRRAKETFEQGASLQSIDAIYSLGRFHRDGSFGGNTDYQAARKWFKEGARLGGDSCIFYLGLMHYCGQGTTMSHEKAEAYFRRSALNGYADSQTVLGTCYHDGHGVVQSFRQARYWWEKAAAQGHESAIDCLRELSRNGL